MPPQWKYPSVDQALRKWPAAAWKHASRRLDLTTTKFEGCMVGQSGLTATPFESNQCNSPAASAVRSRPLSTPS